jgi:hypothetical protein
VLTVEDWQNYLFVSALDDNCPQNLLKNAFGQQTAWTEPLGHAQMDLRTVAILVIWTIWMERDNRIFNRKLRTLQQVLMEIKGVLDSQVMAFMNRAQKLRDSSWR